MADPTECPYANLYQWGGYLYKEVGDREEVAKEDGPQEVEQQKKGSFGVQK